MVKFSEILGHHVSRALQALRSVRQHFDEQREGNRQVAIENEQRRNFAPYTIKKDGAIGKGKGKGRARSCSFKMFCLSSPLDTHVLSSFVKLR